uniref:HPr family phosphocarrier protein n=1 Tax=Lacrimispora amygdalina TaxID=253257 RepID=UPI000BE2FFFB
MIEILLKINSSEEALKLVTLANKLDNDIDFSNERVVVDAKSVMGVLSTDFSKPCKITIYTDLIDQSIDLFIKSIENIIKM